MDTPDDTLPADEAGAAELEHLRGRFITDEAAPAGAPEVLGPDPVQTVAATFRPMASMLSFSSPVCAAFYTEDKIQEISRTFVMLAAVEGWDVSQLESKWALRISFLLVALPPQAIEWALSRMVGFAVGGKRVEEKPGQAAAAQVVEAATDAPAT